MDTVELTTEFGTLNFEDIMPTEQGLPDTTEAFEEDYYIGEDYEEEEVDFEPDFEIEQESSDFEEEMKKVVEIMKIAGDDLSANTIKTMVTDLVTKAREESKSREEQIAKVKMVTNLVQMFRASNAQRATESFLQRKPTVNPVREQLEEVAENFNAQGQKDFSQILLEKAKNRPNNADDFREVDFELPSRNQRPRLHMKPKDLSSILLDKAKARPAVVKDFDSGLQVPVFSTTTTRRPSLVEQDLSHILINKAKKRPIKVKDFDSGLEVPTVFSTTRRPSLEEQDLSHILINKAKNRPQFVKDFDTGLQVPVFSTTRRPVVEEDLSQILINKAKNRPETVKDFDSGLRVPVVDEVPVTTATPDFSQILFEKAKTRPQNVKDFGSGLELPLRPKNLTEILDMPSSKEMIEDHIMEMIIENPERAAADLAELFDLKDENEKNDTEEELFEMMEKDPLAVTSAFTDLILAQKNRPIATTVQTLVPTTEVFEPVKIEAVPEAVRGQMMRMTKKPDVEDEEVSVQIGDNNLQVGP